MIVGLCGKKGAGKDAAGDYLVREHGFTRLSFADTLKISAAACWPNVTKEDWDVWKNDSGIRVEITDEEGTVIASVTAREFLQRYGTEAHRDVFGQSIWTDVVEKQLGLLVDGIVVTDARFENEMKLLKKYGAVMVYLDRPGMDMEDQHASEQSTDMDMIDVMIPNDGTLDDLYAAMDLLVTGTTTLDTLQTT